MVYFVFDDYGFRMFFNGKEAFEYACKHNGDFRSADVSYNPRDLFPVCHNDHDFGDCDRDCNQMESILSQLMYKGVYSVRHYEDGYMVMQHREDKKFVIFEFAHGMVFDERVFDSYEEACMEFNS
jgi:hypothetical protein